MQGEFSMSLKKSLLPFKKPADSIMSQAVKKSEKQIQQLEIIIHSQARSRVPHDFDSAGKIHEWQCRVATKRIEMKSAIMSGTKRAKRAHLGKTNRLSILEQQSKIVSKNEPIAKTPTLCELRQKALGTSLAGASAEERILCPPSTFGNPSKLNCTLPYTPRQSTAIPALKNSPTRNTRYGMTLLYDTHEIIQAHPLTALYISEKDRFDRSKSNCLF